MEKLLGLGVVVQLLASAVVGARLLALAWRTGQSPERWLGAAFVLLGTVGYPLSIAARGGALGPDAHWLLLAALAVQDLACVCMLAATWQTFHAQQRGLGLLLAGALLAVAGSLAVGAWTRAPDQGPGYYLGFAVRMGAFAWAALESHRTHAQMRRRLRLGIADPVVVDRFRLWAVSTTAIVAGFAVFLAARLLGLEVGADPRVLAATSLVGVVSGVSMWLAFFPPAAYLRRVARAGGESA